MSTNFILRPAVSVLDLFDGRLKKFGIQEHVPPEPITGARCLTDGRNSLWVYLTKNGLVSLLTQYGTDVPDKILDAIGEAFGTEIFAEHDPRGYDTKEEWDAAMQEIADRHREELYTDVCAYVRGEPNDIQSGTIGGIKAEIAKMLVEQDPALLSWDNADKLLAEMEVIYDRDHTLSVTLSPED
jgi:hypothetical protein